MAMKHSDVAPGVDGQGAKAESAHATNDAPRTSTWRRDILAFAIMVLVLLSARSTLADHYRVPSGSMQPTVEIGDRIVVSKLSYGIRVPFTSSYALPFTGPQRGDVVVLSSPEDERTLLKRVVALPGDRVEIRNGRIWLDGKPVTVEQRSSDLYERLGTEEHPMRLGGPDFGPITLRSDEYLVLGDNRGNSRDGRAFGLVDRDAILGRAIAVYLRDGGLTWQRL